jgi:hypothetical protein
MRHVEDSRVSFAGRLRQVRGETFRDGVFAALATSLGVPVRTWLNYVAGVNVPGPTLLRFIELTDGCPPWLLSGRGERYPHAGRT